VAPLRTSLIDLLTAAIAMAVIGCGDSKPSVSTSRQPVTVSGTVKIRGKLASEGEISFDPSNYLRNEAPRTAPISKDGRYSITTLVGQNTVRVSMKQPSQPAAVAENEEESARDSMDPVTSVAYLEVQVEIRPDQGTLDIELPAPGESGRR
jgi:hypothetical protein